MIVGPFNAIEQAAIVAEDEYLERLRETLVQERRRIRTAYRSASD